MRRHGPLPASELLRPATPSIRPPVPRPSASPALSTVVTVTEPLSTVRGNAAPVASETAFTDSETGLSPAAKASNVSVAKAKPVGCSATRSAIDSSETSNRFTAPASGIDDLSVAQSEKIQPAAKTHRMPALRWDVTRPSTWTGLDWTRGRSFLTQRSTAAAKAPK